MQMLISNPHRDKLHVKIDFIILRVFVSLWLIFWKGWDFSTGFSRTFQPYFTTSSNFTHDDLLNVGKLAERAEAYIAQKSQVKSDSEESAVSAAA